MCQSFHAALVLLAANNFANPRVLIVPFRLEWLADYQCADNP